jgi:hypothetical protein
MKPLGTVNLSPNPNNNILSIQSPQILLNQNKDMREILHSSPPIHKVEQFTKELKNQPSHTIRNNIIIHINTKIELERSTEKLIDNTLTYDQTVQLYQLEQSNDGLLFNPQSFKGETVDIQRIEDGGTKNGNNIMTQQDGRVGINTKLADFGSTKPIKLTINNVIGGISSEKPTLLKRNSSKPFNVCRICYDGKCEEKGKLLYPCNCKGSVKYVHETCLKIWIRSIKDFSGQPECELCKYKYRMKYAIEYKFSKPKFYSILKSLIILIIVMVFVWIVISIIAWIRLSKSKENNTVDLKLLIVILGCICILMIVLLVIFKFRNYRKVIYEQFRGDLMICNVDGKGWILIFR